MGMVWLVLIGCVPEDADTAMLWCEDAPVVTWSSHGEGLVREHCQPCHGKDAVDRNDAPESVVLDDLDDVMAQRDAILRTSVGEAPTMPPSAPMSAGDQELMATWLRCWLPEEA